jgi:hypothetical protein
LDQPIYRVVWSSDQLEKRFGTFIDYVPGTNLFIREVTEVREVRKYPWLEPQWILEKLFFNQHNEEILDNTTLSPRTCTYEPFWCFGFEDNGRAKRPIWRAVNFLIETNINPKKLTPSEMKDAELEEAIKDEEAMLELLNTHVKSDPLHSAVRDGDAVMLNDANPEQKKVKLEKIFS